MNFKTDLKQLGNFTITGQMKVSDPCYRPEVWCSGVLDTKPGVWEAAIMVLDNEDTGGWGSRVAVLAVKHKDCSIPLATDTISETSDYLKLSLLNEWKIAGFEVGVDSGQAGFYDNDNFINRNGGEDEKWYEKMCNITLSKEQAGVFTDGVVTSSGYGDGGYPCIFHTGISGKVDFAYIIFIGDDDEEQEEDY